MKIDTRKKQQILNALTSEGVKIFIAILIIVDLTASILSSFSDLSSWMVVFQSITFFSAIFFTSEYLLRLQVAPLIYTHYKGRLTPRMRYAFSFFGTIDFIAILPFTLPVLFGLNDESIFDIARIFLVFKLVRYSPSFLSIIGIFRAIYRELLATVFFIGVLMCFSALLMFYIEVKAQPDVFSNAGQGLWWAVITYTSVGYGDIFPVTFWGKVVGGFSAILGVLMFSIPTGIISSAFMKYKKHTPHTIKKDE